MEPELSAGLESKKASVYGRSYAEDLDSYFHDVKLQHTFALFDCYEFIQNAKQLSDIAKISELEAMDQLECLKNLSLLSVNDKGYFKKEGNTHVKQELSDNYKLRAKQHSIRLMQIATQYMEAEKFCDDFATMATSGPLVREFYDKIAEAKKEFIAKSNELKSTDKKSILTFGLGFVLDEICSVGGTEK